MIRLDTFLKRSCQISLIIIPSNPHRMSSILNLLSSDKPDDTSNRKKLIKHTVIEFIATTVFVYFGTLSAVSTGTQLEMDQQNDVARIFPIAFTFGTTIMCLVYAIGHITGHMNPGVSFLMALRGQISLHKMGFYWMAQFLGATLGSLLVLASTRGDNTTVPAFKLGSNILNPDISVMSGFLVELFGSFFFYFVISESALDTKGIASTPGFPQIAIGFSLIVTHICLIPFTGCGVNPARTFGPAIVTCAHTAAATSGDSSVSCGDVIGSWWWIYFLAPLVAALMVAEISVLIEWDVENDNKEQSSEENEHDEDTLSASAPSVTSEC